MFASWITSAVVIKRRPSMTNFHYCFLMSVVLLAASRETGHARGNDGNQAQFKIESQPSGAEVILGKSTLGKTPLSRNALHPGLQPLILKKDGYATLSMQVYLEDGAPLDLGTVTLAKNDSTITIWRVGSPHNGGAPPVEIPNDLRAFVKNL